MNILNFNHIIKLLNLLNLMVNKIFGNGLSRTASKSLAVGLGMLGYHSKHWRYGLKILNYGPNNQDKLVINSDPLEGPDAFTDTPIARTYQELDNLFQGSKFIYTTRDKDSWLESCKNHFQPVPEEDYERRMANLSVGERLNHDIYGTIQFDEDLFSQAYDRHDREVREYFQNRPDDLLVLDIINGDGWEKLCDFLDKPIPNKTFPRVHDKKSIRFRLLHETSLLDFLPTSIFYGS